MWRDEVSTGGLMIDLVTDYMVEDLKSDTVNIAKMCSNSAEVVRMADSLIHLIRKPSSDQYGRTLYYLARKITTINTRSTSSSIRCSLKFSTKKPQKTARNSIKNSKKYCFIPFPFAF